MNDILKRIAEELAKKNQYIMPKPGSVFEALSTVGTNIDDYNTIANAIAIKLGNEVSLIKNKMFPLLWKYSDMVKEIVSGIQDDNELTKYTIKEISIPTIVEELKNEKYLAPVRSVYELPVTFLSIPTPSLETIGEFFKPKFNATVNSYAKGLVEQYTAEKFISLWEKYFLNVSKTNVNFETLGYGTISKLDDVLLLLIAVSYLKDNVPAGVMMPEDEYFKTMIFIYQELLNHISRAYDSYQFDVKYNRLILDSTDRYEIVVNKDVYNAFLEAGGTPEAILGKMSEDTTRANDNMMKDILVNIETYVTSWNNKNKVARVAAIANNVSKYRTAYYLSVHKFYNELMTKDLEEYAEMEPNNARKNFMDYINTKSQADILDVDYMSMEFFGHIVFPNTNLHRFQHYMLDYKKILPDLTPDETASFAACDLIMDYMLNQVDVLNS